MVTALLTERCRATDMQALVNDGYAESTQFCQLSVLDLEGFGAGRRKTHQVTRSCQPRLTLRKPCVGICLVCPAKHY